MIKLKRPELRRTFYNVPEGEERQAMKREPVKEMYHETAVWVNPTIEALRHEECECLNCGNAKFNTPEHCPIAGEYFELIKKYSNAFVMCKCPNWEAKNKWKLMIGIPGRPYEVRAEKNTFEEIVEEGKRTYGTACAVGMVTLYDLYIVCPDGTRYQWPTLFSSVKKAVMDFFKRLWRGRGN